MTDSAEITITINGKQINVPAGLTITGLIGHFEIRKETAIVEHNLVVLDRKLYDETPVLDGDNIELVRFVGGG